MRPTIFNLLVARRMTVIAVVTICMSIAVSLIASAGQRPGVSRTADDPLILAISPDVAGPLSDTDWSALAAHVSQRSGRKLHIVQPLSLDAFEGCLAAKAYDLVLAFPHQLSSAGLIREPIAHLQHRPRGLIVVHSESNLFRLSDLQDARIAIPLEASFAARRLVALELRHASGSNVLHPVPDAAAAYDAVLFGQASASSGTAASFNRLPGHIRARLRVIHQTERHASAAIYPLRRISGHVLDRLGQAFTRIHIQSPVLYAQSQFFAFQAGPAMQSGIAPPYTAHIDVGHDPVGAGCPTT